MIRRFLLLGAAVALPLLSGCVETVENLVLNPDGSGKVAYDFKMVNPAAALGDLGQLGGAEGLDAASMAKSTAREFIEKSEGIDAWSNVAYEITAEGKIHFTGNAYFSDISKVKLGENGFAAGMSWTKNDDGTITLGVAFPEAEEEAAAEPADSETGDLSDEELQQKLVEARAQWGFMKGFLAAMLGEMKSTEHVKLPGEIVSIETFKKSGDREATLEIGGQKVLEAMDKMIMDDEAMLKALKQGKNPLESQGEMPFEAEEFLGQIFGGTKAPSITFKAGKPQFDYAEEVEEAKKNPGPAFKELIAD